MARMTGGEALVKQLYHEGIRVVFGLPGVQLYGTMAALREEPRIRFIQTRHEQATSYMADGYARAGGGVGTALVVPGPGLLNASAGLSTAYSASSPVFMISGQVPKNQIGKDIGVLHEVNDQLECIRPVTKWRRRVLEVADVPAAVRAAMHQLTTGRPRPVEIEMPPETMEEEGEAVLIDPTRPLRPAAAAADVSRAVELLVAAQRPVIYAGGGAVYGGASESLTALAEYLQAGVITSAEGKGAISDHSDLSLGATVWPNSPVRNHLLQADLILAVGTRFALAVPKADQQVIHIDIDPDEIGRNHRKSFGLVGDARATLDAIVEGVRKATPPRSSRKAAREALRAETAALVQEPQAGILKSLREGTPENAILIAGMTQIGYYSRPCWPTYEARTYLSSSYSGNLGYEYPVALGAKVACPQRPVIAVVGDGGFMYNVQELATAVQQKINVIAVVFNDNAFGNVARDLDDWWGGSYGAALHNPDFMKLADAFDVHGMRAKEPTQVGALVREAIQLDRPVLIEVPVGRMPTPMFFPPRKAPTKYQR
jgi:acetolactate synthase I/II/III large subunit